MVESMENTVIRCWGAAYSVQGLIGVGRFSRVYQGTNAGTGERVAVKVLNRTDVVRSYELTTQLARRGCRERAELDVLNELRSSPARDRYVRLMDAVQLQTGPVCFVTERLGATLQAVLHNLGPLPMSICRPVVRQLVQGLTGLRFMGIVHADLKPDNIMFCSGLSNSHLVKIIDFGWAFRAKDAPAMRRQKLQAVPYRAPEVCFGAGGLGHGLDVWALGCITPEMVTGVKLFDATDEARLIGQMVRALSVPDPLLIGCSAARSALADTVPLTTGWIRFRDLYRNTLNDDSVNNQTNEDVIWFADLTYKMLTVMPTDRIPAVDALSHPFLTMAHFVKYPGTKTTKRNAEMMDKCASNKKTLEGRRHDAFVYPSPPPQICGGNTVTWCDPLEGPVFEKAFLSLPKAFNVFPLTSDDLPSSRFYNCLQSAVQINSVYCQIRVQNDKSVVSRKRSLKNG